jgi:hypothetical protein
MMLRAEELQVGPGVALTALAQRNDVIQLLPESRATDAALYPGTERIVLKRLLTALRPNLLRVRALRRLPTPSAPPPFKFSIVVVAAAL